MPELPVVVELPAEALSRLPSAIAQHVPRDHAPFMAALELGYLAASADGLEARERESIAATLQDVTGIGFDRLAFSQHFADLDHAVAALGRRERLARTAAEFETDDERTSVLKFAALVAMADGVLNEAELVVLQEAAAYFQWDAERVRTLVTEAAGAV
jgi:tellurite resistance protein